MFENFKSFLFKFDLIGVTPQLLIFNNKRHKSLLFSLISLIIILFSIFFGLFSFFEYLKFDSPIISYFKDNDENTIRSVSLKDILLMFQIIDSINTINFSTINDSIAYYEAVYGEVYNNGTVFEFPLKIENCEIGKNLDLRYADLARDKYTYGRKVEEFYCLNNENKNLSLFYIPNVGFSFIILYIIYKNNTIYTPENLQSLIVSENNILDHYNKKDPIKKSYVYQLSASFSSLEYTKIAYDLQYINYESDEGLFYKRSKKLYGISFLNIGFTRNRQEEYELNQNLKEYNISNIGMIDIEINKSNFDNYKRSYQRIQSLLAEVMSVVSLLFEIGRQISNILGYKKMNKDIFEYLFNSNKDNLSYNKANNINNISLIKENKDMTTERNKSNSNSIYIEKNLELKSNIFKEKDSNSKIEIINNIIKQNDKILKETNYYNILKSFLCFRDEKTTLINLCNDFINANMCIERILERFYNLENFKNSFTNKKKTIIKKIITKRPKEQNKTNYKTNILINK